MAAPFSERFDAEVAQGFVRANDRLTGLPKYLDLRIVEVGPGTLRAEMPVREELLTPFKTMHGGVISAMCDHVLGCVCYPLMARGQWAATTEFKVNLLAPVTKGVLAANATVISMSKALAVVRIDVVNEGRLAAIAQGTVTIRDPK
ncbi:MAG TPA: PaaI family thioesterase [Myxococcota bacterium]|nr:PaaI family thioesterase [Myxococcota bacterium]